MESCFRIIYCPIDSSSQWFFKGIVKKAIIRNLFIFLLLFNKISIFSSFVSLNFLSLIYDFSSQLCLFFFISFFFFFILHSLECLHKPILSFTFILFSFFSFLYFSFAICFFFNDRKLMTPFLILYCLLFCFL
jgi:glucan phosphoethanolaminetransferase (alkaline phosphatase superfamily)